MTPKPHSELLGFMRGLDVQPYTAEVERLVEQFEARTLERDAHFQRANEAEARERELRDVLAASKEIGRWALENKRCDEPSPQGDMLCDREPGHEGPHVNWQAAEWSQTSTPATRPGP